MTRAQIERKIAKLTKASYSAMPGAFNVRALRAQISQLRAELKRLAL